MGTSLCWITDSIAGQSPAVPPDRIAVALDDQAALTWEELRAAELRHARALQKAGVRRGDRVGLLLGNSVDYLVLYLAVARVGAVGVRLNWRLTAPELQFILNDSGTKLLVLDAAFEATISTIRDALGVQTYAVRDGDGLSWGDVSGDAGSGEAAEDLPVLGPDDPLSLMYTSGTTGRPKGAIWTHGNALWFGSIQAMKWRFDRGTVAMTPGPLFHAGGLEAVLLPALLSHGTAITHASGGFSLERLLEVCRRRGVTTLLLYSFMVYDLLRLPEVETLVPPTLTRIIVGGDTLMPWVYDDLEKRLPGVEMVQVYGLTEGGAISTCLDHDDARAHAGAVGRPLPLTEVKVLAAEGTLAPPGETGEVYVRSPAVSPGYWERPEANAETFTDGWCRTGDLGRVDADGFLSLAGRAKDMIRSGGENVYPAEVEAVLTTAPHVADAAVVGVPDPRYHEVGCAVLVPIAGERIDVEQVREHCAARLARYKIPRHFVVEEQLPRTASGKVKKFELRAQYASLGDPSVR